MNETQLIVLLVLAIFVIEFLGGRHRNVHNRSDLMIIGSSLLSAQVIRPIMSLIIAAVIGFVLPAGEGALSHLSFWLVFPGLFFVAEFFHYWLHRFAHDSVNHKLLYGMHRTHHSAPYVNVTLIYRSNICWGFVHPYGWFAGLAIYLGHAPAAATFFLTIVAWNIMTHSDWRWDDAIIERFSWGRSLIEKLEWFVITPRIHHTHHGYGKDGKAYRNFNTMLTCYDRLFGTLHVPDGRPLYYGLPGGEHHWARQMLFPLVPLGEPRRVREKRRSADVEAERLARKSGADSAKQVARSS